MRWLACVSGRIICFFTSSLAPFFLSFIPFLPVFPFPSLLLVVLSLLFSRCLHTYHLPLRRLSKYRMSFCCVSNPINGAKVQRCGCVRTFFFLVSAILTMALQLSVTGIAHYTVQIQIIGLDGPGFEFWRGLQTFFKISKHSRPEGEADLLFLSTEVRNMWSCSYTALMCLHGMDREKFPF